MIRFSKIEHNLRELFPKLPSYFAAQREVDVAYLFGSYGLGEEAPLSDVDIAVLLREEVARDTYFDLRLNIMADLVHLLKTNEVDLVILNEATIVLAYEVVSTREVLFERDPARRIEFEVRVYDRYFDSKPLRRVQQAYFLEQIRTGEAFG